MSLVRLPQSALLRFFLAQAFDLPYLRQRRSFDHYHSRRGHQKLTRPASILTKLAKLDASEAPKRTTKGKKKEKEKKTTRPPRGGIDTREQHVACSDYSTKRSTFCACPFFFLLFSYSQRSQEEQQQNNKSVSCINIYTDWPLASAGRSRRRLAVAESSPLG